MRSLALVLLVAACHGSDPAPTSLPDLSASLDAARAAFDAHQGEARFVALLAPT